AGLQPYPFGPIVQLLVLTGQRRSEIAALRREWVNNDERRITFPGTITKNRRTHVIPYGDNVHRILSDLPNVGDDYFPAARTHVRGKPTTVFNGWSKAKAEFSKTLDNVAPWTLHDLRRTLSSTLAALGTPIHVTEKLLNHTSGTVSGVAAIYNRYNYMPEMHTAVAAFEGCLNGMLKSARDEASEPPASQKFDVAA
ncbi:MAG TPA: tyrosine-type recombinase/integrase, partial [Aestuariivirgaceae bacterium]|nr:tyrosine-type recombinase/integrase [Aestuariivirgaceae bacterium]